MGRYIRIFYLLLYVLYALTPVNIYTVDGSEGLRRFNQNAKHESADIVWVNVIFSYLVDAGRVVECAPDGQSPAFSQPTGDVILVKKKRALYREQFGGRPLFDMQLIPHDGLEPSLPQSSAFSIRKNPLFRETKGYLVLNTGLSPPSLLS